MEPVPPPSPFGEVLSLIGFFGLAFTAGWLWHASDDFALRTLAAVAATFGFAAQSWHIVARHRSAGSSHE